MPRASRALYENGGPVLLTRGESSTRPTWFRPSQIRFRVCVSPFWDRGWCRGRALEFVSRMVEAA
jgi:hypothetical protein